MSNLETDRLILRSCTEADAESLYEYAPFKIALRFSFKINTSLEAVNDKSFELIPAFDFTKV